MEQTSEAPAAIIPLFLLHHHSVHHPIDHLRVVIELLRHHIHYIITLLLLLHVLHVLLLKLSLGIFWGIASGQMMLVGVRKTVRHWLIWLVVLLLLLLLFDRVLLLEIGIGVGIGIGIGLGFMVFVAVGCFVEVFDKSITGDSFVVVGIHELEGYFEFLVGESSINNFDESVKINKINVSFLRAFIGF